MNNFGFNTIEYRRIKERHRKVNYNLDLRLFLQAKQYHQYRLTR